MWQIRIPLYLKKSGFSQVCEIFLFVGEEKSMTEFDVFYYLENCNFFCI